MNTTLFSFSGPVLDLFPLEIIPVVENIHWWYWRRQKAGRQRCTGNSW